MAILLGAALMSAHTPIRESTDHFESAISGSKCPKVSESVLSKAKSLLPKVSVVREFPRS